MIYYSLLSGYLLQKVNDAAVVVSTVVVVIMNYKKTLQDEKEEGLHTVRL